MKDGCDQGRKRGRNGSSSKTKEKSLPFWLFLFYEGDAVVQVLLEHLGDTFEEPKGQTAIQIVQDAVDEV